MRIKQILKYLWYSKSLRFVLIAREESTSSVVQKFKVKLPSGDKELYIRPGTSDAHVYYEILFRGRKSDYFSKYLPIDDQVNCIVDIGANIGVAAIFFKERYPGSEIHCFEPMQKNINVLKNNISRYSNISVHQIALSSCDGEVEMIASPVNMNEGGWSMFQRGATGDEEKIVVHTRVSGDFLKENSIAPDIIKVDTEGAESEILFSLHEDQINHLKYVTGELHGERDFRLIDWLESNGFDIEMKKTFGKSLFIFKAIKKELL